MKNIILLNKPKYMSSNELIQIVKDQNCLDKIGHAGTLDPFATGLIIAGINDATKQLSTLILNDKEYEVEIQLHQETKTLDSESKPINYMYRKKITLNMLLEAVNNFNNIKYFQKVPLYSATKINGKKLYQYAINNIEISCPIKLVKIIKCDLVAFDYAQQIIKMILKVSKGFYVRSFAMDFANYLNTVAYVKELNRISSGEFLLKNTIELKNTWIYDNIITILDENTKPVDNINLVIGEFDLIHKQHYQLFNEKPFNILTFINNPSKKEAISSMHIRIRNLKKLNPNKIYVLDLEKFNISSRKFLKFLAYKINPSKIIVGDNFRFGKNAKGDVKKLKKNFNVKIIKKQNNISTSKIKTLIIKNFNEAITYLQYLPSFDGYIIKNNQNGTKLGFKTANFYSNNNFFINPGSYICKIIVDKKQYQATCFVWQAKNDQQLFEVHIHNFDKNIYYKYVVVELLKYIAKPRYNLSDNELIVKIKQEVEEAKNFYLNKEQEDAKNN